MAATECITVRVTAAEKARIANLARGQGLSVGEFLRQAVAAYRPAQDAQRLEAMLDEVVQSTTRASAAIDKALACVEASDARMRANAWVPQGRIGPG